MKIRNGYVSNSSSSSFCIPISALKRNQIEMIKDHIQYTLKYIVEKNIKCEESHGDLDAGELGFVGVGEEWNIEERTNCIYGYTTMNNFDIGVFIIKIVKVKSEHILWGDDSGSFKDFEKFDFNEMNKQIIHRERKSKLNKLNES